MRFVRQVHDRVLPEPGQVQVPGELAVGIFSQPKGSISKVVTDKARAGKPHGGGAASDVQARQAKARKAQIKEDRKRKAQEARDIKRAKILSLNGPPNAGKSKKFNEKAIRKGDERRAKAAAKAAAKKAQKKAKGFWA